MLKAAEDLAQGLDRQKLAKNEESDHQHASELAQMLGSSETEDDYEAELTGGGESGAGASLDDGMLETIGAVRGRPGGVTGVENREREVAGEQEGGVNTAEGSTKEVGGGAEEEMHACQVNKRAGLGLEGDGEASGPGGYGVESVVTGGQPQRIEKVAEESL